MFSENKEIFSILKGYKTATARDPNNHNKNIKVGDDVGINIGLITVATATITDIKAVDDIHSQPLTTFKQLGYPTKKSYFNEYPTKNSQLIFFFKIKNYDLNQYIELTKKGGDI